MQQLAKLGIGAGIAYLLYKTFAAQMANPTGPAQAGTGSTSTLTPNYQLTPGRVTVLPPGITPTQQRELDAFDRSAGQLTDDQLAQIFGWQSFNDWFNSLTTQNQANNVASGANPRAAAYGRIGATGGGGGYGGGLNPAQHFDALEALTLKVL